MDQEGVRNLPAESLFTLLYEQPMNQANYFFDNQTICAHYDGSD